MDEEKIKLLLGNNIKKLRERLNYTQEKFCSLIKIEQPTLSNIENGKSLPHLETLISIIKVTKVSPESLFDFIGKYEKIELSDQKDIEIISYILNLPQKTKLAICEILKAEN